MTKTLVVAQYKEKLDWLDKFPDWEHHVIRKNSKSEFLDGEFMPNVGRETFTFIRYIIRNYDNLDGIYAFVQGNPYEHCVDFDKIVNIPFRGYALLGDTPTACFDNGIPHHAGLPIGSFYKQLFGFNQQVIGFLQGGQWMATAEHIKSISIENWLLMSDLHKDSRAPWVFERLWPAILTGKMFKK
jgi:hypothetical protein